MWGSTATETVTSWVLREPPRSDPCTDPAAVSNRELREALGPGQGQPLAVAWPLKGRRGGGRRPERELRASCPDLESDTCRGPQRTFPRVPNDPSWAVPWGTGLPLTLLHPASCNRHPHAPRSSVHLSAHQILRSLRRRSSSFHGCLHPSFLEEQPRQGKSFSICSRTSCWRAVREQNKVCLLVCSLTHSHTQTVQPLCCAQCSLLISDQKPIPGKDVINPSAVRDSHVADSQWPRKVMALQ